MIPSTCSEGADLYLAHRAIIDKAIGAVARRYRFFQFDGEDFASTVHLHFIQNNFSVLRQFRAQSSLKTYVLSVVTHLGQDWRNMRWGKWRPSAEASRQGPLAMHLERLIHRDGLSFDEAYETLRTNFGVTEPRAALEAIASKFPARVGRRLVGDHQIDEIAATGPGTDGLADWREAIRQARTMVDLMTSAIKGLPADDVLLLELRFGEGMRIVDIAHTMNRDQKSLYRRIDRLLLLLRLSLERQGLNAYSARDVVDRRGFDGVGDACAWPARGRSIHPDQDAEGARRAVVGQDSRTVALDVRHRQAKSRRRHAELRQHVKRAESRQPQRYFGSNQFSAV